MPCLCSAKALSKYTEMVDSLIREQMDALAAASDEARLKLREWELPECLMVSAVRTRGYYADRHREPNPKLVCLAVQAVLTVSTSRQ